MRSRAKAAIAAGALGLGSIGIAISIGAPAQAVSPSKIGWWSATATADSSVPSGVPAGGGYVQSELAAVTGVTALHFDVPMGQTALVIVLPIASVTDLPILSDPVSACAIAPGWKAGPAQSLVDAPVCKGAQITAKIVDHSLLLSPSALEAGRSIDIELRPAPLTEAGSSTAAYAPFTMTLAPPGNALTTSSTLPPALAPEPVATALTPTVTASSGSSQPPTASTAPSSSGVVAAVSAPPPASPPQAAPAIAAQPSATLVTRVRGLRGNARQLAIAGLALVLVAFALLTQLSATTGMAGRRSEGGIGRFRERRDGHPDSL